VTNIAVRKDVRSTGTDKNVKFNTVATVEKVFFFLSKRF